MKTGLSGGEWTLMKALWDAAPMTITQLTAALKDETGWSKHTIISMLSRLENKGAVTYYKEGRAKRYEAKLPQGEAIQTETRHFLDKVFDGSLGVMVHSMVDSHALSTEELAELSAILEQAKGESSP